MKRDWLWDKKLNISQIKQIFKNPTHKKFMILAALLLTRKNEPKEIFKEYMDPILFCKNWNNIKKIMYRDKWARSRIIFWQAIYEKLMEKYRKQGIIFRKGTTATKAVICKTTGNQIREIRKKLKLSQKKLADKIGISQQLISRIEKGKENISLTTLETISDALNKKIIIHLGEK